MVGLETTSGNPAAPPYRLGPYKWDQDMEHSGRFDPSGEFDRYTLTENFAKLPQLNATIDGVYTGEVVRNCNTDFEILGTSASDLDVTFSTTVAGIQLQTDGGSADQVIVLPHLDSLYSAWTGVLWGTENQTEWECILRTDASIADVTIWAGLKLTNVSVVATDADQVFFRFDGGVANWEAVTSIGGTDTETDTGAANIVAINTTYKLKVKIDSARVATFFINNTLVHTTAALTDNIDFIPYVGVQDTTAAAKTIVLSKEKISRIIFE